MLIWLASYPRSGNTFARIILNEAFGIKTQSLSGDGDDRVFGSRPSLIETVGHQKSDRRGLELADEARSSAKLYIIKTHEPPLTDDPCIYIVRDGRSALISYYHYIREIENFQISLESVIRGHVYGGSWSEHFTTWNPANRPNTIVLRYEEITRNPDEAIRRIGNFCAITPQRQTLQSFDDLHKIHPEFFRGGNDDKNILEIMPCYDQFVLLHGAVMAQLGYGQDLSYELEAR